VLRPDEVDDLVIARRVHEVVDRDVHGVRRLVPCAVGQLVLRDDQIRRPVEVRDRLVDDGDVLDA